MMERTGVEPVQAVRKAGGMAMAQARNTCLDCLSHRECRNWLQNTEGLQFPPDFCPNADFFRACVRRSPWAEGEVSNDGCDDLVR